MKTSKIITIIFSTTILIITFCAGWYVGTFHGIRVAYGIVRNETAFAARTAQEKGDKQLFEYLKARYYYFSNCAHVRLKKGEGDFGPVDEDILKGYTPGKELSSFNEQYELYKRLPGF